MCEENRRVWLVEKGIKQRVQHVVGLVTITISHSAIVWQGWDWLLVLLDCFPDCLWVLWVHLTQWSIATVRFWQALLNSRFLFFMERTIDLFNHGRFLLEGRSLAAGYCLRYNIHELLVSLFSKTVQCNQSPSWRYQLTDVLCSNQHMNTSRLAGP